MENLDYIDKCIYRNVTTRWSDDSLPLKIFIEHIIYGVAHDAEKYFINQVKRALNEWGKASDGKIITELVDKKSGSDIIIEWHWKHKSAFESDKCLGICRMYTRLLNKTLKKSIIKIYLPFDRPIMDVKEFYSIILHELGHAFGIFGHSDDKQDIMYKEKSAIETLSIQDKNTIKLLYSLNPGTNKQYIENLAAEIKNQGLEMIKQDIKNSPVP